MRERLVLILLILVALAYAVGAAFWTVHDQLSRQPLLEEKLRERDVQYVTWLFADTQPSRSGIPDEGAADAPLVLIAVLDPTDEASKVFFDEVLPTIREEFIVPRAARLYLRMPLSREEYDGRTERFLYNQAAFCVRALAPSKVLSFVERSIGEAPERLAAIAQEEGVRRDAFEECVEGSPSDGLLEDVARTEQNMLHLGQRIYVGFDFGTMRAIDGIPAVTQLRRALRYYQMRLGE